MFDSLAPIVNPNVVGHFAGGVIIDSRRYEPVFRAAYFSHDELMDAASRIPGAVPVLAFTRDGREVGNVFIRRA